MLAEFYQLSFLLIVFHICVTTQGSYNLVAKAKISLMMKKVLVNILDFSTENTSLYFDRSMYW